MRYAVAYMAGLLVAALGTLSVGLRKDPVVWTVENGEPAPSDFTVFLFPRTDQVPVRRKHDAAVVGTLDRAVGTSLSGLAMGKIIWDTERSTTGRVQSLAPPDHRFALRSDLTVLPDPSRLGPLVASWMRHSATTYDHSDSGFARQPGFDCVASPAGGWEATLTLTDFVFVDRFSYRIQDDQVRPLLWTKGTDALFRKRIMIHLGVSTLAGLGLTLLLLCVIPQPRNPVARAAT